ncbi:hypothetical protein ACQPYH_02160 [Kribbella sp. CA-245084]|uniref:hypothetical protein n=1 Tax=Kribbella sp. CA-245084 TaxID=3239940 RepID=UPI003D93D2E0
MRYRRVLGSVYVDADVAVTARVQAEAALLLTPGAVVSHQTALRLWTADDRGDDVVHVTVERDPHVSLPRVNGLRVHEVQNLERVLRDGCRSPRPDARSSTWRRTAISLNWSRPGIRWYGVPTSRRST